MKSILFIPAFIFFTAITALAQFGTLDTTFGQKGTATTLHLYDASAYCVAVQPDGKILTGGSYYSSIESTNEFLLTRFNSDGTIDSAFGTNGIATTLFFKGEDYARSIALQKNGKILLVGSLVVLNSSPYDDFAIARYNHNGTIDSSFGSDGQVTSESNFEGDAEDVTILNNGEILVSGSTYTSDDDGYYNIGSCIAKYTSKGVLDKSFNNNGFKKNLFKDSTTDAAELALQTDGKIIMASTLQNNNPISISDIIVTRLTENGSTDSSFGLNGSSTAHIKDNFLQLESMALQDDNKIVVIADIASNYGFGLNDNSIAAIRFNADGSMDNSFGNNGMIKLQYDNKTGSNGRDLLILNDKILIAGYSYPDSAFLLTGLNNNGTLDSSFGNNGFTLTHIKFSDRNNDKSAKTAWAFGISVNDMGKIIAAGKTFGSAYQEVALARYHAQPILSNQDSFALVDLYNSTDGAHWANHTNWLQGPVKTWYGITLSQPTGDNFFVKQINLAANNLKGTIPSSIGKLSYLQNLYLNNNQLSGNIPSSLDSINSLITLDLSFNQLSGSIPKQICNKNNLVNFYLDNNQVSGSIPNIFNPSSKLVNLYLNQNNLTGVIPKSIGNLKQLQFLFLAHNDLTGAIPDTLRNIKTLKKLLLADNELKGTVPSFLNTLPYLDTLNIEHNYFTFAGMERLVQHGFSSFLYDNQRKITIHQNGNTLSVNAGGTLSNNTYKWYKGSTLVATIHGDSTFNPTGSGTYYLQVTNSICTDLTLQSSNYTFSSMLLGKQNSCLIQTDKFSFLIQPNPAHDFINVYFSNKTSNTTISVYDVNGQKLITQKTNLQKENSISINISSLAAGTYFIEVISDNKMMRQKFVKE